MLLYVLRMTLTGLFLAIAGGFGTLYCLLRPNRPENLKFMADILKHGSSILGFTFVLRNKDYFKEFPAVLVSNHQENMDVFIGAHTIPIRCVSLGKRSILYIPFFGLFYWLSGNILINRSNKRSAIGTMDTTAKKIIDNNISVWILPEGTRSKGRGVLPFKKGAFITAIKAQVPIYPIAISSYKNINFKRWNAGTVITEIMPPISTKGMNIDQANELKELCHSLIKNKVAELDCELEKEI